MRQLVYYLLLSAYYVDISDAMFIFLAVENYNFFVKNGAKAQKKKKLQYYEYIIYKALSKLH